MPIEDKNETEKEIKSQLEKISQDVKESGEKALAEAEKGIALAGVEKERVDELLLKQGELQEELKELSQKMARRGTEGEDSQKSVGQRFVEDEGFSTFSGDRKAGSFSMDCKAVNVTSATTGTGAAGDLVMVDRVNNPMSTPGLRRLTIRDLIANGLTSSSSIEYTKESGFANNAAIQENEGDTKAQSDIEFDLETAKVETIAHWIRTSKQILADAPRLQSYIDGRMTYGLKLVEEDQILMGAGTAGNLNGIYTQATAYSQPAGAFTGTPTMIDILRLALLQSELAEYPADGIVLNPIQWAGIELLKDSDGRHIIGNPQGTLSPMLWSRPVIATQAMTTDKFLVGAFGMGAEVFDREDAAVLVSTEDGDNFTKNLVTIRAEERLALAVYRTEAFIKGDLGQIA